ncbi:MAG: hypothetical protein RMI91_12170, partial [Gemmatales bacterium]|nr:hypothetical protein [Gemmatales bacterium]
MGLGQLLAWTRWIRYTVISKVLDFRLRARRAKSQVTSLQFDVLEPRTLMTVTHRLVADIQPGSIASAPRELTNVSGTVFFVANSPSHGWQLWRTDGTTSGTLPVRVIGTGSFTSRPRYLTNVNGTLFFVANDGSGDQIWRSQGDASNTLPLPQLTASLTNPRYLTCLNNTLYFVATSPSLGTEIFRATSPWNSSTLVADINPTGSADPAHLFPFGQRLLFSANDGSSGFELWAHDAALNQTYRVADINPGSADSHPAEFAECHGRVYFAAQNTSRGRELWATDATPNNITLVADINPNAGNGNPRYLTNVNNRLFFSAVPNLTAGAELHMHDPVLGVTQLFKDIRPSGGSDPRSLTNVSGTLFFAANDGAHGYELWLSDLTAVGTRLAIDFHPAGNGLGVGHIPGQLVNSNGILFLAANDGATGLELFIAYELPQIKSVHLPPNGLYGLGSTLSFTVRFNRPVQVTGVPRLRFTIHTGTNTQFREATYTGGTGSDTLTFHYPVQAGDQAADGITLTSPIILPSGASITDTAGNAARLTLSETPAADVQLDGIVPQVVSLTPPSAGLYGIGQILTFRVRFSEAVQVAGTPRLR